MQSVPTKIVFLLTAATTLALGAGCEEFATPSQLDRPQIIAMRAQPPAVRPGQRSTLSVLVAGPDGEITPLEVDWSAASLIPNEAPIGTVGVAGDGTPYYEAPATQPETDPSPALVEARVTLPGESTPLLGNKAVVVTALRLSNPIITRFAGAGQDLLQNNDSEYALLTFAVGSPVALSIDIEGGITDDTSVAWFATVGEIAEYRSNPAELLADEPGRGWLFVVVRDGRGGVAWARAQLGAQ